MYCLLVMPEVQSGIVLALALHLGCILCLTSALK